MTPELTDRERDLVAELPTISYAPQFEWVERTFREFVKENPDEEEWDNIWEFVMDPSQTASDLAWCLVQNPQIFDLALCHDIEGTARDLLHAGTLAELLQRAWWTLIANTCLQLLIKWDVRPIRGVPEYWFEE